MKYLVGLTIPKQAAKRIDKPTTFPGFSKATLPNKNLIKMKNTDTMEQNRVIEEITLPPKSKLLLTDLKTVFDVGPTGINKQD